MTDLIQFVGDPFVDAGVAVLEVRLQKPCAEMNEADLARQADELEELYSRKAWTGYLTVHFPNSCWCNFTMGVGKKAQKRSALLRSFDAPAIGDRQCAYCQRTAQHLADRSVIPLLTGEANMTTGPGGEPGLPVCSACQYSIQFYPLATLKVMGRPLFWWTPQHEWMFYLTSNFAKRVAEVVEGSPEHVPSLSWPFTLLLTAAEEVLELDLPTVDLVGCHATNYGSGPDYNEIRVSRAVLDFLKMARGYSAYRNIRETAWEVPKAPKGKPNKPDRGKRNLLYEELGRRLKGEEAQGDTVIRQFFRPYAGREPGVFELACIYAKKVLHMTQEQVEAIKELAGQIAVSRQAEKSLARLFRSRSIIRNLTEISDRMKRSDEPPLPMDLVVKAFDVAGEDDATGRDQALVRELILIRIIELLPKEKLEALPPVEEEGNQE